MIGWNESFFSILYLQLLFRVERVQLKTKSRLWERLGRLWWSLRQKLVLPCSKSLNRRVSWVSFGLISFMLHFPILIFLSKLINKYKCPAPVSLRQVSPSLAFNASRSMSGYYPCLNCKYILQLFPSLFHHSGHVSLRFMVFCIKCFGE